MEAMMKKKMFTYQLSTHHGVQTQEMLELCGFSSESIRNSRNGVPKQKNLCRKVKKASHRDLPDTDWTSIQNNMGLSGENIKQEKVLF